MDLYDMTNLYFRCKNSNMHIEKPISVVLDITIPPININEKISK